MPNKAKQPITAISQARGQAFQVIGIQVALGALIAAAWGLSSLWALVSAVLGAITVLLPSIWFVWRWFRQSQRSSKQLMRGLILNECVKFGLIVILAMLFLTQARVETLPFFCGLLGTYFGLLGAPIILMRQKVAH
ncbi:MAG: ATP synthase subunit I [Gammaproteobacteria bacterium]|nr:ATP synthase subunit I [Gammaproteobacteria bacterium]